ncbi:DUF2863 family protein [Noviherbaspirillum sp.]|uniref:DUF2863 family protein n=1 Tax=Noviherbaspirillum sp. TaxID=1926288 RepID=UPI002D62C82C|nr:DUF2863 family protein [Noviherbaspirillum sp.]HZW20952.1 DUF2863 family protein [Noviherbaspirillum sp.]
MKKTRPTPGAKAAPAEDRDDILSDRLVALALDLREAGVYAVLPDALKKAQSELRRTIRKCLQQKREQALDEALERTWEEDADAYRVLRAEAEELSGTILLHRDEGPDLEINAFVVPLFVHTTGGLRSDQDFHDEQAFEQLRDSFQEGGLESRKAKVVLVAHAYHLDEIEHIGYCHLHEMVHEAGEAMTRKKAVAADAIARSMRGWPPSQFGPDDSAMELRFLLGFALKTMDDPFYQVPEKEAAADRYFAARAERFRKWSQDVAPLLRRCLVNDGREAQIDFLYQDLFHGGRDAAVAELDMLRVLSEVQQALEGHACGPDDAQAIIGPTEADDGAVLRVSLRTKAGDAAIAAIDKTIGRTETPEAALADLADALDSIGIGELYATRHFDMDGMPAGMRPLSRKQA